MPLATCLVNETKREFCIILTYNSEIIREKLLILEKAKKWDLSNHFIYVCLYNVSLKDFKEVTGIMPSTGGEIINEYIQLI